MRAKAAQQFEDKFREANKIVPNSKTVDAMREVYIAGYVCGSLDMLEAIEGVLK